MIGIIIRQAVENREINTASLDIPSGHQNGAEMDVFQLL